MTRWQALLNAVKHKELLVCAVLEMICYTGYLVNIFSVNKFAELCSVDLFYCACRIL